jgi:hypothetical protein
VLLVMAVDPGRVPERAREGAGSGAGKSTRRARQPSRERSCSREGQLDVAKVNPFPRLEDLPVRDDRHPIAPFPRKLPGGFQPPEAPWLSAKKSAIVKRMIR